MKSKLLLSAAFFTIVCTANAQTDTAKIVSGSPARIFGSASQYRTWSVGINVGLTSAQLPFMSNSTNDFKAVLGYGADIKDQISHGLSIRFDYFGGTVTGDDALQGNSGAQTTKFGASYFRTTFNSFNLSGVINIGNISFLRRQSGIIIYGSAGLGLDSYKPGFAKAAGATSASQIYPNSVSELDAPLGAGLKFKLSNELDLNLGYTMTFVDNYNFAGFKTYPQLTGHYGYTYTGLEYTLGLTSKPGLAWANPAAIMYEELYDAGLRQEAEALKIRVAAVEAAADDLKKDSDNDGVSDYFDKCPNTPAGTVVDGSGCPLPPPLDTSKLYIRLMGVDAWGMGSNDPAAMHKLQNDVDKDWQIIKKGVPKDELGNIISEANKLNTPEAKKKFYDDVIRIYELKKP